ncbi:MAG: DsrE family protein [Thermofilaceae archaeon]
MTKVVVQVAEAERAEAALASCKNLINAMPDAEVEVVLHQSAVSAAVKGSGVEDAIRELISRGVKIAACGTALGKLGIDKSKLIEGVAVVDVGVAEIVKRQKEGWLYLRL